MQEQLKSIQTIPAPNYIPNGTMYRCKVVTAGNKQQIYNYTEPQRRDYTNEKKNYDKKDIGEKRQDSLTRTRNKMVLMIDANVNQFTKLVTLTFAKTMLDREQAEKAFKHFLKSFKREFGYSLKYLRVTEHQTKRGIKEGNEGSLHFHLVVFNPAKIDFKRLHSIWSAYGSIDIKLIRNPNDVGRYLAKYLTKDNILINKKGYTRSRNLIEPTVEYLSANFYPEVKADYSNAYIVYQANPQKTRETFCFFYEYRTIQRKPITPYSLAVDFFGTHKVTLTT